MTTQTVKYDEILSPVAVTARGKPGATATPVTLAGGNTIGPPTTGAHVKGEFILDDTGVLYYCSVAGTPGTWVPGTPTLSKLTSASVPVPPSGKTQMFAKVANGRIMARTDEGTDGLIDFRRVQGKELRHWKAALANRNNVPANVYVVGDSVAEGAGATLYSRTWMDIFRDSIQREYRQGGEGWIPPHNSPGMLYANRATLGVGVTETDFGAGFGRRAVFLNATTQTVTYTAYCDRFQVMFATSPTSGTFKVTCDGVVLGTQSCVTTFNETGRVWDSGALPLGTHTIIIQPNAVSNAMFIEGVHFYATDYNVGVHVWNGGHGGGRSENYNGDTAEDGTAVGARRCWPQVMFQPYARITSGAASVTANGTTALTWTGGAFDANDVGEVVFGTVGDNNIPRGLRIVSVTDATHIVVSKTVPAGTYTLAFTRSRQTDVTRVINTTTLTSATAVFNQWDAGKTIGGDGLTAGTTIRRVISPTQVDVYPAATSSGTNGTIQIKNRQLYPMRPDLLLIEIGGNDMFFGVTRSDYKTNMQAIYNVLVDNAQLDVPTMTGISNDERPSVVTMNAWGTNLISDTNIVATTVNGSANLAPATTGLIRNPRFDASDIGHIITGTGIQASSHLISVSADGLTAVMDKTATASSTNVGLILLARQWQDWQWLDFRQVQYELAVDNDWMNFDLYNLGGNVGFNDYLGIASADNLHPNDRGQQWIADELASAIGGVKKLASIPQGIFDNAGEMIKATTNDVAQKVPGIKVKLTADVASSAVVGTYTTIPEWAFNLPPNETLTFQFYLIYTAAAATSGLVFRLNGVAGMSQPADICMCGVAPASASTFTYVGNLVPQAWPQAALTGTGSGAAVPAVMQVYGAITAGAVGGLVTPEFSPEVAFAVTLQRGSFALIL